MTIIQITPDGYLVLSGDAPEQGRKYALEDATDGTLRQGRAFHPLVQEWFNSGCHSYTCSTWLELREYVKRDLGEGFTSYLYADETGQHEVKTLSEIPDGIRETHIVGRELKSWSDYTKKERTRTIENLISSMHQSGVQTKRFYEILKGMEGR